MADTQESAKIVLKDSLIEAEQNLQKIEEGYKDSWELVSALDKLAALYRLDDRLPEALNLELRSSRAREKFSRDYKAGSGVDPASYGITTEFDGLKLLEVLGDGATAVVFRARDERKSEDVAVKIFKLSNVPKLGTATNTPEHLKKFEKESTTLRKLDCPNIVSVHRLGTTPENVPYIVMECVDGRSIKSIVDDSEVFNAQRAIAITREVCRALTAAHAQNIIHRDLKPSNIIVNDKNDAKVVDFGIAKAMGIDHIDATITQVGSIVGSPAYMSPEQCMGEQVDARSDIYSLGCTLFEMLTGTRAFAAETTVQAIAKQINPDRSGIRKSLQQARVSRPLENVIMRCVDREPKNRYQTVAELDHDLSSLQLNKPIAAETNEHANKYALYASIALLILVAILVIVYFLIPVAKPIKAGPPPPPPAVAPVIAPEIKGLPIPPVAIPPRPAFTARTRYNPARMTRSVPLAPPEQPRYTGIGWKILDRYSNRSIYEDPEARDIKQAVQDAVKAGVSLRRANLQNADLTRIRLASADFSDADLSGAKLTQATLVDSNFSRAIMVSTVLGQATLSRANFTRADMRYANLVQAKAAGSDFSSANMTFADLSQTKMNETVCPRIDLRSASLSQTQFDRANLRGANFENARLTQVNFASADLMSANFTGTRAIQCQALGATLTGTRPAMETDTARMLQVKKDTRPYTGSSGSSYPGSYFNSPANQSRRLHDAKNSGAPSAVIRSY